VRIAQLANFVGPRSGGLRTAVAALGAGYLEAGCERLLVIPGPTDDERVVDGTRVVQIRGPRVPGGYRLVVEPWRVVDALRRFGPTSVELSDKLTLAPVGAWARRHGIRTVLLSHERLDQMWAGWTSLGPAARLPVGLLNRYLVRRVDAVVVTSRFAQEEFAQVAAAAGCPVHRIGLGVDLDTFRPSAGGSRRGPLRLVHAGRLSREKSPALAVATAVELHRRGVDVRLDVYGDGPQRAALARLAGPAPVFFHGFVESRHVLSRRLAEADVALSVCPHETFGLAVLEALASGTPVVTADRGGAAELAGSTAGASAEPEPAALADAVLRVAARPEPERRAAARRRAEQFPWSLAVDRMLAVHQGLPEDEPRPADLPLGAASPP